MKQLYLLCYHDGNFHRNGLFFQNFIFKKMMVESLQPVSHQPPTSLRYGHPLVANYLELVADRSPMVQRRQKAKRSTKMW